MSVGGKSAQVIGRVGFESQTAVKVRSGWKGGWELEIWAGISIKYISIL